jgi:parallel beta-helix repeat protein
MDTASKSLALIIIALFLTSLIVLPPIPVKAQSKTIVVPDDYPTIQSAIDHTNTGDTVFVKNGVYYLSNSDYAIIINKPLTLTGENARYTIIDGQAEKADNNQWGNQLVFQILAPNVEIKDLTLQRFDKTVIAIGTAGNGCKIVDNNFLKNYAEAISTQGNNNIISGNYLSGNAGGIDVGSGENLVYDNTVINGGWGIIVQNVGNVKVYNNKVLGNNLGFSIRMGNSFDVSQNEIKNNIVGLFFDIDCHNSRIYYNDFEKNSVAIQVDPYISGNDTFGNLVYNNNFIDNNQQVPANSSVTTLWDNGKVGNYWSDFNGQGNYTINKNNVDHHPLTQQKDISTPEPIPTTIALILPIAVTIAILAVLVSVLLYRRHQKTQAT